MSNRPGEGLDRRGFLISSIATAGATALGATASNANAQGGATISDKPSTRTIYTGDVIGGKKVVSALDINELEPGKKHFLFFQGVEMPTGQHWLVSVTVARGVAPGKRGVLISGVHGDEMSSVHTVQTAQGAESSLPTERPSLGGKRWQR